MAADTGRLRSLARSSKDNLGELIEGAPDERL